MSLFSNHSLYFVYKAPSTCEQCPSWRLVSACVVQSPPSTCAAWCVYNFTTACNTTPFTCSHHLCPSVQVCLDDAGSLPSRKCSMVAAQASLAGTALVARTAGSFRCRPFVLRSAACCRHAAAAQAPTVSWRVPPRCRPYASSARYVFPIVQLYSLFTVSTCTCFSGFCTFRRVACVWCVWQ